MRRRETAKALDAFQHAIATDTTKSAPLVDVASYLMDMKVQPEMSRKLLEQYLAGNAKSDAAPAIHVHVLLGRLLQASGDKFGAKAEYNKALQLAASYSPAQKALQGL